MCLEERAHLSRKELAQKPRLDQTRAHLSRKTATMRIMYLEKRAHLSLQGSTRKSTQRNRGLEKMNANVHVENTRAQLPQAVLQRRCGLRKNTFTLLPTTNPPSKSRTSLARKTTGKRCTMKACTALVERLTHDKTMRNWCPKTCAQRSQTTNAYLCEIRT